MRENGTTGALAGQRSCLHQAIRDDPRGGRVLGGRQEEREGGRKTAAAAEIRPGYRRRHDPDGEPGGGREVSSEGNGLRPQDGPVLLPESQTAARRQRNSHPGTDGTNRRRSAQGIPQGRTAGG